MLYTPEPVRVGLQGRSAFYFNCLLEDGSPFVLDAGYDVQFLLSKWAETAVIATLAISNGRVQITDPNNGTVFVELDAGAIALLSAQRTFNILARVLDQDNTVLYTNSATLLPANKYIAQSFPMAALLSTRFMNTPTLAGVSGGVGHLNGLATLTQPVGCAVQFFYGGNPPEVWVLETWTSAAQNTASGAYQQPLDFNSSSNPKVWRKVQ
jgi:hypothetical protein